MKVGYRAGDLNKKSDTLASYFGGGRSTGYHGSGFYFVKDVEEVLRSSYESRPLYKLTFRDDLKWFHGDKYSHEVLKKLHNYVYQYDYVLNFEDIKPIYRCARYVTEYVDEIVEVIKNSYSNVQDEYEDFLDWLYDRINQDTLDFVNSLKKSKLTKDIYNQFQVSQPDWKTLEESINNVRYIFDRDYIKALDSLVHDVEFRVPILFNVDLKQINNFAKRMFTYVQENENSKDSVDSVVTVFLKELGFDGVWPDNEIDNTYYGGVVFEKDSIRKIEKLAETVKDFKG